MLELKCKLLTRIIRSIFINKIPEILTNDPIKSTRKFIAKLKSTLMVSNRLVTHIASISQDRATLDRDQILNIQTESIARGGGSLLKLCVKTLFTVTTCWIFIAVKYSRKCLCGESCDNFVSLEGGIFD